MLTDRSGNLNHRAIGFLVLAASLVILCVLGWKHGRLIFMGKHAEGVITHFRLKPAERSVWSDEKNEPSTRIIAVRFTPEGGSNTEFSTTGQFGYYKDLGQKVQVLYLEHDPQFAEIDSAQQFWLPLFLGLALSAGCFGVGNFLIRAKQINWRAL